MKSRAPFRDLECMRPHNEGGGERLVAVTTEIIGAEPASVNFGLQIVNWASGTGLSWAGQSGRTVAADMGPCPKPGP